MYEHLKKQILETRQDWSDAYDEYVETDKRRESEIGQKRKEVENLRKKIERIEGSIGQQIRNLDLDQ
jgi:hypothetical protein